MRIDPNYQAGPSYDVLDALKLPILFYTVNWTPEKKAEWLRITGSSEASTKVMCDHLRSAISFLEELRASGEAILIVEQRVSILLAALKAAAGYLTNAAIDLTTGAPKRTALATVEGGLKIVNAAIAKATESAP